MTQLSNTFEGGSAGTTISNANSGGASGDAFDTVDQPVGATVKYDTVAYQGSLAMAVRVDANPGTTGVEWNTSLGSPVDNYCRWFFYVDALPSVNDGDIIRFETPANALMGSIVLRTTGRLGVIQTGGAAVGTNSTTILSPATWYRLETHLHGDTATGFLTLRIYTDPTAAVGSFTEELNGGTPTTWAMGSANNGFLYFGASSAGTAWPTATTTQFARHDGLVAGATNWVGPIPTSGPPPALIMAPMIPAYSRS